MGAWGGQKSHLHVSLDSCDSRMHFCHRMICDSGGGKLEAFGMNNRSKGYVNAQ
jgi:hypothetical protein